MSEPNKKNQNSKAVPFFVRYLEGQYCEDLSEEEMKTVGGGQDYKFLTKKYPSDQEDSGDGGWNVVTLKYPSDQEECGGGGHTDKYPSDQEDSGIEIDPDLLAVTHKYPSDGDDDLSTEDIKSFLADSISYE